ncbi:MAG TPA: hypothetical protein PLC80_11860 [Draconibacterium sp.]|nr:hypothetical protein [Draconibacterium sp.]
MKTMKTKKKFIAILILMLLMFTNSGRGAEQYKGDTIRIKFDDFMIEVITSDLIKNPLKQAGLAENATKIIDWLKPVNISEPESDELIYILISIADSNEKSNYENVIFENRKRTSKKMVFSDGKILEKDFGNYIIEIRRPVYTIKYYLQAIQDLKKISAETFSEQIANAEKLLPDGRKKINGWMTTNKEGSFDTHFLEEVSPVTLDMLILNAGVGAGVIKNQWVNDINFKIGLGFMKKGLQHNVYFAELKMYYDFSNASNDNLFSVNSFVTVGWEHNYSKILENEKWFGVSLGYLVDRNTDFFNENTWKFGIHKRINQTISVNPELYFDHFFKNVYPGVQIGISF